MSDYGVNFAAQLHMYGMHIAFSKYINPSTE